MTINAASTYLKFANLQMAAEAIFGFNARSAPNQAPGVPNGTVNVENGKSKADLINFEVLIIGNDRKSVFTEREAKEFSNHWQIVERR